MADEAVDVRGALSTVARDMLAQRRLLDFAQLVNPRFDTPKHIHYLADRLNGWNVATLGASLFPLRPGHGKSVLLQTFAAWFLGRETKRRILQISASESLAKRNSRDAQVLVRSDAWPWPALRSRPNRCSSGVPVRAARFERLAKGGVISGFRAEGVVVDDLQSDAGSEATAC